jgi:hypothetical protein
VCDVDTFRHPLSTPGARFSGHHGKQNVMLEVTQKRQKKRYKSKTFAAGKMQSFVCLDFFETYFILAVLTQSITPETSASMIA